MKSYKALVEIRAECESDFKEQLDHLDGYELEWWCDCGKDEDLSDEKDVDIDEIMNNITKDENLCIIRELLEQYNKRKYKYD